MVMAVVVGIVAASCNLAFVVDIPFEVDNTAADDVAQMSVATWLDLGQIQLVVD